MRPTRAAGKPKPESQSQGAISERARRGTAATLRRIANELGEDAVCRLLRIGRARLWALLSGAAATAAEQERIALLEGDAAG